MWPRGVSELERIDFPVTGNLRPGDVLRTVYLDKDECAVRDMQSAEGRNLFEIALDDYEPGCKQEVWNIEGSGAFVHRDWRDGISLPNMILRYNEDTGQTYYWLSSQDGTVVDALDDGRQHEVFRKLLRSSHYSPMSTEEYRVWVEEYKVWHRKTPQN